VIHPQLDRNALPLEFGAGTYDGVRIIAPRETCLEPAPSPAVHDDEREQAKQGTSQQTRSTGQTAKAADSVSGASTSQAYQNHGSPPGRIQAHTAKQPQLEATPTPR
jgi:hypothetical protein